MRFKTSFLILAFASSLASAEELLRNESSPKDLSPGRLAEPLSADPDLPNREALSKWREVKGYVSDRTNLESYPKLSVDCADQKLYPTHPQQLLKLYHRFDSNQYNQAKLHEGDEPCLIAAKNGTKERRAACLRADIAYDTIISDTFEDACGHFYRGFTQMAYLGRNETMGTLFSAGRTALPKPGSKIENELVPGHTYPVPLKKFLFVGPLLPGDEAEIAKLRDSARAGSEYDPATRTYRMKP